LIISAALSVSVSTGPSAADSLGHRQFVNVILSTALPLHGNEFSVNVAVPQLREPVESSWGSRRDHLN
jgi:hypothetical protein